MKIIKFNDEEPQTKRPIVEPVLIPVFREGELRQVVRIYGDPRDHVNCRCRLELKP